MADRVDPGQAPQEVDLDAEMPCEVWRTYYDGDEIPERVGSAPTRDEAKAVAAAHMQPFAVFGIVPVGRTDRIASVADPPVTPKNRTEALDRLRAYLEALRL